MAQQHRILHPDRDTAAVPVDRRFGEPGLDELEQHEQRFGVGLLWNRGGELLPGHGHQRQRPSSSFCSLSGTTLSATGPGTCYAYAAIASDTGYRGATSSDVTVTFTAISQSISFTSTAPDSPVLGGSYCSITGSAVSFTGAGMRIVDANQAGDADYSAALQAHQQLAITVTSAALCALNLTYVEGASSYQRLHPFGQDLVRRAVEAACHLLTDLGPRVLPAQKANFVAAYGRAVQAMVPAGWMTQAQALDLQSLADEL